MKKSVWISYDLGVKGDYTGLYTWLDSHGAIECGNSFAFISFNFSTADIVEEIKESLTSSIQFNTGDMVYIVYTVKDENGTRKKTRGQFIIGNRKSSPWEGYAPSSSPTIDE